MWLLDPDILDEMHAAIDGNIVTAEDQQNYVAEYEARGDKRTPRLLTVAGNVASIQVTGALTDTPDFLAFLFGGGNTVYADIRAAIAAAEADPEVTEIELDISSGGGMAGAEWFATMEAVYNTTKPTRARVRSLAASAAYGIASQADTVTAQNRMSRVGSIGVIATLPKRENVVQLTSTNAPNKRPDVNTKEGRAAIREEIDAIEAEFIDLIARGRDTSTGDVTKNFGRGGIVLAAQAESRGMIDAIGAGSGGRKRKKSDKPTAQGGQQPTGVHPMDLEELKAEHPAVYKAAVQDGVTQERSRVNAHLTLAEGSGATDIALKAIADGVEANDVEIQSKHMKQAMLNAQQTARAEDDGDASGADNLADNGPEHDEMTAEEKEGMQVVAALEAIKGDSNDELGIIL